MWRACLGINYVPIQSAILHQIWDLPFWNVITDMLTYRAAVAGTSYDIHGLILATIESQMKCFVSHDFNFGFKSPKVLQLSPKMSFTVQFQNAIVLSKQCPD